MRIAAVVGARPQLVKLLPLSRQLSGRFETVIIHTGQHYDDAMSGLFLRQLDLPAPDFELDVRSDSHAKQTGRMLVALDAALDRARPDLVITFGDTNTTLAGALCAAQKQLRSLHIEAGLRSFDRSMPEEVNRLIADRCSDHLFAPTPAAMSNLELEGLASRAVLTGDLLVDALGLIRAADTPLPTCLDELGLGAVEYDLLTLHRSANVDDPGRLRAVMTSLRRSPRPIVFPVHPRTRKALETQALRPPPSVRAVEPLGPLEFVALEQRATKIITDSGGVQREAYLLGVPCIVLRPASEWVELVDSGWSLLADPAVADLAAILDTFEPAGERPPLLGSAVAERMVEQIGRILTHIEGERRAP